VYALCGTGLAEGIILARDGALYLGAAMISNLMFVAFGTGILFGLLVFIVCLMAGVGLAWSVAAGLGICICYIIAVYDVLDAARQ
jgi:hypothetical protein